MKLFLLIGFAFISLINHLNSMSYPAACSHLCVGQDATKREVDNAFNRRYAYYQQEFGEEGHPTKMLKQAKGFLDGIFIAREIAQKNGSYEREIQSCIQTGFFNQQLIITERNTESRWANTIIIDRYDYQRIALVLGLAGIAGLAYWYYDALESYFNPKPKSLYEQTAAKLPFFSSRK